MNGADVTLSDYTSQQLRNLCREAGFTDTDTPAELLRELLGAAGGRPLSAGPLWPSDVADDATPVEFSFAFDDGGDRAIRVLGETIAERPGPDANVAAARRFLHTVTERYGCTADRFEAVQDLFLPERPRGKFALWFSLIFRPGAAPRVKVYFNPDVRGPERARELVAEGLRRLGMDNAYDIVLAHALSRGDRDRFSFFALDLDDDPLSRVKLYVSHAAASVPDVERAAAAVSGIDRSEIGRFCALVGGSSGPFAGRPLISSYSLVEADPDRPGNYSLYLPVRDYVPDDETARSRIRSFLAEHGLDPADLDRALGAVSGRPLRDGRGLLAHVSLRLGGFGSGTTVYLSSEAYDVTPPRRGTARPVPVPLADAPLGG
ncbi:DMATS type aromatic prenyltransferase [Prauserella shujinwangii]|uniref:DMATS type aromatic prenyltransferase n=1 Tax=Prauserella shujinwangii TaxID=1453103 RepID=A0A2T0M2M1_9PSEU|nr:tryptophan dimethylallyltransferase family protein [Prauserella shujinwangii]PRX50970.1 DMATS type aromatic prenyltransferase [Prauserella shujinwangii]